MLSSQTLTPATTEAIAAGDTASAGRTMRGSKTSRAAAMPAKCSSAIATTSVGAANCRSMRTRNPAATIPRPHSTRLVGTETATRRVSHSTRPVTT